MMSSSVTSMASLTSSMASSINSIQTVDSGTSGVRSASSQNVSYSNPPTPEPYTGDNPLHYFNNNKNNNDNNNNNNNNNNNHNNNNNNDNDSLHNKNYDIKTSCLKALTNSPTPYDNNDFYLVRFTPPFHHKVHNLNFRRFYGVAGRAPVQFFFIRNFLCHSLRSKVCRS
jgi:hypothetical protein